MSITKNFIVVIFLLFVCICNAQYKGYELSQQEKDIQDWLSSARMHLYNKAYKQALEDCESAEVVCPTCAQPLYTKAVIYNRQKDEKATNYWLQKAKKKNPSIYLYQHHLIEILMYNKKYDEVFKLLQAEIDKNPVSISAGHLYNQRAWLRRSIGKYNDAYEDLVMAVQLLPKSLDLDLELIFQESFRPHQKDCLQKLLAFNNELRNANANKAIHQFLLEKISNTFFNLKMYDSAIYYHQLIRTHKYTNPVVFEALLIASAGKCTKATNMIDTTLHMLNNPSEMNNLGYINLLCNRLDSAEKYLQLAFAADKQDEIYFKYDNMGYLCFKRGGKENLEKAIAYHAKALAISGTEAKYYWEYVEEAKRQLEKK